MSHSDHQSSTTSHDQEGAHGSHAKHGSHDKHAGHSVAMFRDKFWLSLALTIPIVIWSPDLEAWLGYSAPTFPGSDLVPAVLGTVVFLYGGLVFLQGAVGELRPFGIPSASGSSRPAASGPGSCISATAPIADRRRGHGGGSRRRITARWRSAA